MVKVRTKVANPPLNINNRHVIIKFMVRIPMPIFLHTDIYPSNSRFRKRYSHYPSSSLQAALSSPLFYPFFHVGQIQVLVLKNNFFKVFAAIYKFLVHKENKDFILNSKLNAYNILTSTF